MVSYCFPSLNPFTESCLSYFPNKDWVAPDCDLFASDCPRVTELPDSYVEVSGGGFACAEGFAGNAVARCVPDDTCESSLQWFGSSGIIRLTCFSLFSQKLYDLMYLINTFLVRHPRIRSPIGYLGVIRSRRAADSINTSSSLFKSILPTSNLPNPSSTICYMPSRHAISISCQGCQQTAACAPPLNLIGCLLDVTQCSEVKPGGSCPVSCRFPYTGWSSVAVCRPDNVNSEVGLLVVEPECTLTCEDPPNEPEGYVKVSSGNGWACAPGYGGEAKWDCVIDSVCASKKVLSGCSLLARCILPSVENACMYDFTNCIGETASPGESCQVHCKRPYQGNSSNASCPSGNTDPLRELNWEVPNCQIACAEVSDVPVGYLSHPYIRVFGGWQCTDGYAGTPSISCATDANCNPQLRFSGCSALLPCDPPILSPGELCAFQHTCISVRSGDSCEVTCRAPYVGGIAQASCPPNNTQIGRQLIWAVPDCNLQCPMPNPIPSGYQPDGIDNTGLQKWKCAPFWEGTPVVTCFIGDGCVAAYQFSGCVLQCLELAWSVFSPISFSYFHYFRCFSAKVLAPQKNQFTSIEIIRSCCFGCCCEVQIGVGAPNWIVICEAWQPPFLINQASSLPLITPHFPAGKGNSWLTHPWAGLLIWQDCMSCSNRCALLCGLFWLSKCLCRGHLWSLLWTQLHRECHRSKLSRGQHWSLDTFRMDLSRMCLELSGGI